MDEIKFLKGRLIHINGIPFELKEDTIVLGNKKNLKIVEDWDNSEEENYIKDDGEE